MKVGTKLGLGFGALTLVLVGNSLLSLGGTLSLSQEAKKTNENVISPLGVLVHVAEDFELVRVKVRDLIFTVSPSDYDTKSAELDQWQAKDLAETQEYGKTLTTDKGKKLLAEFLQETNTYADYVNQIQAAMAHGQKVGAIALLQEASPLALEAQGTLDAMVASKIGLSDIIAQQGKATSEVTLGFEFAFTAVGVVISLLIGVLLTRSITRPLQEVNRGLGELARGNFSFQRDALVEARKDELGDVARSAARMVDNLRRAIGTTVTSSTQLNQAGEELARQMENAEGVVAEVNQGIKAVSDHVLTQSASVTQTSASAQQIVKNLEDLRDVIEQQAANVTESSAAIEQMIANIGTVTANVDRMVSTFSQLRESTDDGRAKVETLDEIISHIAEQSERLQEANNVIEAIASQTSLLSMNAAIEAAHAGEAGRGFAVVADEIRKLSELSTGQSKEIAKNIQSIGAYIQSGAAASKTSKASFDTILDRVGSLGNHSSQVKAAMDEQSLGSQQILEAIAQINLITAKVQEGAAEMRDGGLTIQAEMQKLLDLSQELLDKTGELTGGTTVITEAVQGVKKSSAETIDLAQAMATQMEQFKI